MKFILDEELTLEEKQILTEAPSGGNRAAVRTAMNRARQNQQQAVQETGLTSAEEAALMDV